MSQLFQILRCYNCETFQVQFVKKVLKWQCKICNEKQSVKKICFKGSGKDCRIQVQKLNEMRSNIENFESDLNENSQTVTVQTTEAVETFNSFNSKWKEFLDDSEGESQDCEKCKPHQETVEKNEEFALISNTPSHRSTQPQTKRDRENETLHTINAIDRANLENELEDFIPKRAKLLSSNSLFDHSRKDDLDDILKFEL